MLRNLQYLFRPQSVAVIGASPRLRSVGERVMHNLLEAGFTGPVMPVNPKHTSICGVYAYPTIAKLPITPDLAVVCTPPRAVPDVIAELGARGSKAAIVLTAGLKSEILASGTTAHTQMLANARRHNMRILGPNCVGLLVPGCGLNASFAHAAAKKGRTAFVSQSGALCTAVLDWANARGIGFSSFVSLGDGGDIGFADMLSYLTADPDTSAILLYIESITDARAFVSAARKAAMTKPVICIKAGRSASGSRAAASHTGALTGSDAVFDAVLRRAGVLRVDQVMDLFEAVETLARCDISSPSGELTILTNGGGPGVIASDELTAGGGLLSELSPELIKKMDAFLPATWSRANPADIIGDAPPERYVKALEAILQDPSASNILVMHVPTAISPSGEVAEAIAGLLAKQPRETRRRVMTTWLGQQTAGPAREYFTREGIATYNTPDEAVNAFLHLVHFRRNQMMLRETPQSMPDTTPPQTEAARALVAKVLGEGRKMLTEPEAKALLGYYHVPVVRTQTVATPEEAARAWDEVFRGPCVLKILSKDISHKSDVGGVALNLSSRVAVAEAAASMLQRISTLCPKAKIDGFTIQDMVQKPKATELIIGVSSDPVFGPVILFGHGGTATEVIGDTSLGLPPLNMTLSWRMIQGTQVYKLLKGFRDRPAADIVGVQKALVQVSQLVQDIPEVVELDINPLLADEHGVVAVDARVVLAPYDPARKPADRLAILPYPRELEERVASAQGPLLLRPIRPEDESAHFKLISRAPIEDLRNRFGSAIRPTSHEQLTVFTQIDYNYEMAFIADDERGNTLGVVRLITDDEGRTAEFSLLVDTTAQGRGLGRLLMDKAVRYCQGKGIGRIVGDVLPANARMLKFCQAYGFTVTAAAGASDMARVELTVPTATAK